MKKTNNVYATNQGGVIKAPKPVVKNTTGATVIKGNDLRDGTKRSK